MNEDAIAEGGCACGRVALRAVLPTKFVCHCHCANCRRAHGAAFVTFAGFPRDRVEITAEEGALARWVSGTGATRAFCTTCGTTVSYESPRWPEDVHLARACLDGPLDRTPTAHAYADRAPDWCPITDALPQYGGPSGTEPLER